MNDRMNNYFELKNIHCSYNKKDKTPKVVLEIDNLEIPRGELVFIVGQSGCGKSTILETLGLMNNTMLSYSDSVFNFYPKQGTSAVDFLGIWKQSNKVQSKIRLDNFSFIFQQTNLMRNFSIYENIAITQMLQGASKKECDASVKQILEDVNLSEFYTTGKMHSKAYEASGGQQQRIAFARAMGAKYNIIFCDEPTGNLDPQTADDIMGFLHHTIKGKEDNKDKTAIIVSHDLPLALRYADRIVKIFKEKKDPSNKEEEGFGHIKTDSIFVRNGNAWLRGGLSMSKEEVLSVLKQ